MALQKIRCDVLVIGSGAAGLAAAISAAEGGHSVLVAERHTHLGGTSAISGGWMWLPGNPIGQATSGDSREEVLNYLRHLAKDAIDEERLTEFLDVIPEMVEFFERKTDVSFVYPELSPDYSMLLPGAMAGGRAIHAEPVRATILNRDRLRIRPYKSELTVFGVMPQIGPDLNRFLRANSEISSFAYVARRILKNWTERLTRCRGLDLSNGNALIARMISSARKRGVEFWTSTQAMELRTEGEAVIGAVLRSKQDTIEVTARQGVVLASGGFSHDQQLRQEHFRSGFADRDSSPMTAEHDGASARLASQVGGYIESRGAHPAAWCAVSEFGRASRPRTFPHLRGFGLPGLIAVNHEGRRFTNEAESYHAFGPAMVAASAEAEETHAYFVGDRRTMHKYGIGFAKPWPIPRIGYLASGYLLSGHTLKKLAEKMDVDADNLRDTIERFNADAQVGTDTEFGRGTGKFNRFKGDPDHGPNPTLGPIQKKPFYAARVRLGDLGTFAGLATGPGAQVRRATGDLVPGLHAVGTAAASVFAGTYPGAGAHLGPAMAFGYLAGRTLRQHSSNTPISSPEGDRR